MMIRSGLLGLLMVVALVVAACGGDENENSLPVDSFAVIASGDIATGPSRVLVGLRQPDGAALGSPDIGIEFVAAPLDEPTSTQKVPGVFTWIVEDAIGLYRAEFQFDQPGTWQITARPEFGEALAPAAFTVLAETLSPNIGDPAPVAPTPTLSDLPLVELTTDPNPDPRFYQISLEDALASGKVTVLVFSTPAYCQTAACGPMLEIVKEAARDLPDLNFIHVEVYTGLTDPDFVPDPAHLAPAAGPDYWNLPTEPWVFVIDGTGRVTARFEGVMAPEELAAAL
jgi:hypothetical protein